MVRDQLVRRALEETNWDLMACSMPSNVLLTTGYWPAAGYSLAVATRGGQIFLIVPEDEDDVAELSWADDVRTYTPVPLDRLMTAEEPVYEAFSGLKSELGLVADRIGFEQAEAFEPAAYAPNLFRGSAARILRRAFPSATLAPADELLAALRAVKTSTEIQHIRTVCRMSEQAFRTGARCVRPGASEPEIAMVFRTALSSCAGDYTGVKRCDAFTYCMSGPNSGRAWGPYSRSRNRTIELGDVVIVRCHSYADGYWADVTRTYVVGEPRDEQRRMFDAVFAARDASLDRIRTGVRGAEVDEAARSAIEERGFDALMKHAAGHGAGFGTLDHTSRPRLHPKSDDVIEDGMVLKLELGVYCGDFGGVRMSDMVAVEDGHAQPLTPFHWALGDLAITSERGGA